MGLAILGSSSENRNKTTTNNVSSGASDDAFSLSTTDSEVMITDGGAIAGTFDVVKSFLETTENISLSNTTNNRAILDSAIAGNVAVKQESMESEGDNLSKIAMLGLAAAAAVAALKVFKGK